MGARERAERVLGGPTPAFSCVAIPRAPHSLGRCGPAPPSRRSVAARGPRPAPWKNVGENDLDAHCVPTE
jgi:hypothetical protein